MTRRALSPLLWLLAILAAVLAVAAHPASASAAGFAQTRVGASGQISATGTGVSAANFGDAQQGLARSYDETASGDLFAADTAVSDGSLNAIANGDRIGSGLKADPFHSAPTWAEPGDIAANGQQFSITGADGVSRTLVQSPASVNGISGRFEWIINPDGTISHQLFVPGGGLNGVPIQP
jgi:predicted lipoprotein with Yx(FWY)xxD motif